MSITLFCDFETETHLQPSPSSATSKHRSTSTLTHPRLRLRPSLTLVFDFDPDIDFDPRLRLRLRRRDQITLLIFIFCSRDQIRAPFDFDPRSLTGFLKLSLASAIMLCLELWYYTAVILVVGGLQNPAIAVDAISICMNLQLWTLMIALGFNAAVSVRVSNELGAGRPKAAKFSIVVTVLTSATFGVLFTVVILVTKNDFPKLFTTKPLVLEKTSKLGYFLAATIFLNSIQPVLHGVAVGAGWQFLVAFINTGCYYVVGLPIGALLGYVFKLSAKGIWAGMLVGGLLQTVVLLFIVIRTNWNKEALQAGQRVRTWGGPTELQQTSTCSTQRIGEI